MSIVRGIGDIEQNIPNMSRNIVRRRHGGKRGSIDSVISDLENEIDNISIFDIDKMPQGEKQNLSSDLQTLIKLYQLRGAVGKEGVTDTMYKASLILQKLQTDKRMQSVWDVRRMQLAASNFTGVPQVVQQIQQQAPTNANAGEGQQGKGEGGGGKTDDEQLQAVFKNMIVDLGAEGVDLYINEAINTMGSEKVWDKLKTKMEVAITMPNAVPDLNKLNAVILYGPPGTGKCLGRDTPVIMYDGSVKMVQDVVVGDLLMGDDSTPRTVLSTCTGQETLYKVIPEKGDPYVVNESHILSLKSSGYSEDYPTGSVIDIPLRDYLNKSFYFQQKFKGYRVAVEFPNADVPLDPYVLGYWLGNGFGKTRCNAEPQILHYLKEILPEALDQFEDESEQKDNVKCNSFNIVLNDLDLMKDKRIPQCYLSNDRLVRLEILAGIIDSNGSYRENDYCYHVTFNSEELADDAIRLCRSLGFAAYKQLCTHSQFSFTISGCDLEQIPVLLEQKRARPSYHKKDVLMTGIKVEKLEIGDYYGFVIDGNHRFLLGDFTVTHNTMLARQLAALRIAGMHNAKFMSVAASAVESKYHGESARNVRALWDVARESVVFENKDYRGKLITPVVVFFDEFDALFSGGDHSKPVQNEFLTQMEGLMSKNRGIFFIAATNNFKDIPANVMNRFSEKIWLGLPGLFENTNAQSIAELFTWNYYYATTNLWKIIDGTILRYEAPNTFYRVDDSIDDNGPSWIGENESTLALADSLTNALLAKDTAQNFIVPDESAPKVDNVQYDYKVIGGHTTINARSVNNALINVVWIRNLESAFTRIRKANDETWIMDERLRYEVNEKDLSVVSYTKHRLISVPETLSPEGLISRLQDTYVDSQKYRFIQTLPSNSSDADQLTAIDRWKHQQNNLLRQVKVTYHGNSFTIDGKEYTEAQIGAILMPEPVTVKQLYDLLSTTGMTSYTLDALALFSRKFAEFNNEDK